MIHNLADVSDEKGSQVRFAGWHNHQSKGREKTTIALVIHSLDCPLQMRLDYLDSRNTLLINSLVMFHRFLIEKVI